MTPTDTDKSSLRNPVVVEATNGRTLQSGCVDLDDPDAVAGEYLLVLDEEGNTAEYIEMADMVDYHERRLGVERIMRALAGEDRCS